MVRIDEKNEDDPTTDVDLPDVTNQIVRFEDDGLPGGELQAVQPSDAEEASVAAVPIETETITNEASPSSSRSSPPTLPIDENNHKYVGLVNQAMTCYLNSLVQSLYMTPEFRNALYDWEYVPSGRGIQNKRGEHSIPCQLQKLFLLLQTTDRDALETRDLTGSFGWTSAEAYEQHDVQELCRLMFDALEQKWRGTIHEKLIQDLYRGTMQDFVKCLTCGKESARTDYFLDLPLAVKPFGAKEAFSSIEEALQAFVQPELLEGTNQYECAHCKKKQDAYKGLRITQFPYLVTIQLKRFDFDYSCMHRVKLNDRMSFPDVLDLNRHLYRSPEEGGIPIKTEKHDDMELGTPDAGLNHDDDEDSNPYTPKRGKEVRVGQPIDQLAVDELFENGEYVYELFSVMVHSGSASGGHYYAYIKNMEQDKWYSFNDARVDFASPSEVERSFGGGSSGMPWNTHTTNAYMLMYRKIDRSRNVNFMHTDNLPPHITNLQHRWKEMEIEADNERRAQESLLRVHVSLNYPVPFVVKNSAGQYNDISPQKQQIYKDLEEYITEISRDNAISTVYNQAFDLFQDRFNSYGIQLIRKNSRLIFMEQRKFVKAFVSKADMDKKSLRSLFDSTRAEPAPLADFRFVLDVRIGSVPFGIEPKFGYIIRIRRVDVGLKAIAPDLQVFVDGTLPIIKMKELIGAQFRDDIHAVLASRLVLECALSRNQFLLLDKSETARPISSLIAQHTGNVIPLMYYDGGLNTMCSPESASLTINDRTLDFDKSQMFRILDRKNFSLKMRIRFPSPDEVQRAASTNVAYKGPSWAETVRNQTGVEPNAIESCSDDLKEGGENDDDPCISGRVSTASMRSMDDLDSADIGVSGSFCNNTPQMSPSVSDGDDYEMKEGEITEFEYKNQLNAENTIKFLAEQRFQSVSNYHRADTCEEPSISNRSMKSVVIGEDACSEMQSHASSGQSTIVPSTSNFASNQTDENDSVLNGKVVVLSTNDTYRELDLDSRLSMGDFKVWIANQLSVEKDQFVIVGHNVEDGSDSGYEVSGSENESVERALRASSISIKLRPPLKFDERMIPIIQFDMLENNKENWKTLFEVAASPKTFVGDILLNCIRLYKEIYAEELKPQQVRLREFPSPTSGSFKPVLNLNEPIEKRYDRSWNSPIYMQIITDESVIGRPGEPIFVRRFRPSTVEITPTHEILVNPSAESQNKDFLEALSKVSNIPLERLAITDCNLNSWTKWPYTKSRLDLLDGKEKFFNDFYENQTLAKSFICKVGVKVIYYKDSEENAKILSEDERKQIKIKENGQSSGAIRRKEKPLRIQVSSTSEA